MRRDWGGGLTDIWKTCATRWGHAVVIEHLPDVKEAEVGLAPGETIGRVGIEKELNATSTNAVTIPEVPRWVIGIWWHDVGIAVVQARLPRRILDENWCRTLGDNTNGSGKAITQASGGGNSSVLGNCAPIGVVVTYQACHV